MLDYSEIQNKFEKRDKIIDSLSAPTAPNQEELKKIAIRLGYPEEKYLENSGELIKILPYDYFDGYGDPKKFILCAYQKMKNGPVLSIGRTKPAGRAWTKEDSELELASKFDWKKEWEARKKQEREINNLPYLNHKHDFSNAVPFIEIRNIFSGYGDRRAIKPIPVSTMRDFIKKFQYFNPPIRKIGTNSYEYCKGCVKKLQSYFRSSQKPRKSKDIKHFSKDG